MLQNLKVFLGLPPKAWIPSLQLGEASSLLDIVFLRAFAPKKRTALILLVTLACPPFVSAKKTLSSLYIHGYFHTYLLCFSYLIWSTVLACHPHFGSTPWHRPTRVPTRILSPIGFRASKINDAQRIHS